MFNRHNSTLWLGITLLVSVPLISNAARIVSPNERGLYYALPAQCADNFNCTDWSGIGAYLGQFSYQQYYDVLPADALKLMHGRFQHFADFDDWTEALFPYSQFVQYDASQVAAGQPSLFASATYQNQSRPVLWNWYGVTTPPYGGDPGQAVNLKDERFIQFWVNQYIHPWLQKINKPNVAVLLDNCTFDYSTYGVNDNAGNFITGITWDQPYAQSQADFLDSVNHFSTRVHQIDPGIKLVCNTDASSSPSDFLAAFQNMDGINIETAEYFYQSGDAWWRSALYNQYLNVSWAGNAGKIGLLSWQVPTDGTMATALRRDYMHYLMVRGDNFFFAPHSGYNEVPPTAYAGMKTALGVPVAATAVTQEPGLPQGYVLYSRVTSGGIAYLNWTGAPKTITLPAGSQYVNSSGQPVTQITIPDMSGDYVLFSGSSSSQSMTVSLTSPANGSTYTSSSTITMTAAVSGGSIARVEFYQGANLLGAAYSSPYTWTIYNPAPFVYSGIYALTARAVDTSGATITSSPVAVTVTAPSQPMTVSLTSPSSGALFTAPATITMTAAVSDPGGSIDRVEFYQGANLLGTVYSSPYTWTVYNAPAGSHSQSYALTARAIDKSGTVANSPAVAVIVKQ